jgi:ABC-2 type transport system permease protein
VTAATTSVGVRSGPRHWLGAVSAMLRWHLTSMRLVVPVMVVVQILIAAGFSVGMSLFFEEVPPRSALFLGTGAGVINLILVGLIVSPQLVASEKEAGTYDFTWSLPVPRSASVVAWVILSAIVSIPAMIAALLVAGFRFDLGLSVSPAVVPAVLLVVMCATMIGYAIAQAIERPTITQLISQVLAFGVLGFTPITFPLENLPAWLADIHQVLPFYHMGVVVRAGLTDGLVSDVSLSYLTLSAWTLMAVLVTALVLGRRK